MLRTPWRAVAPAAAFFPCLYASSVFSPKNNAIEQKRKRAATNWGKNKHAAHICIPERCILLLSFRVRQSIYRSQTFDWQRFGFLHIFLLFYAFFEPFSPTAVNLVVQPVGIFMKLYHKLTRLHAECPAPYVRPLH